jgi:hypothetical protein
MAEQIDHAALKQVLEDYVSSASELKATFEELEANGVKITSPLTEKLWAMSDRYGALIEAIIGKQTGILEWYIWENDCGRNGIESGPGSRPIKTVEDLAWLALQDTDDN